MTTLSRVKALIVSAGRLPIHPDAIDPDGPLFGEGLGLDSLDALEIMIQVEREFGVTLPETEQTVKTLSSARSLADYIDARMAEVA